MRKLDLDKEVESMPIKATFPIKGKFYFIHEILNDYSDIGFNKFTKIIERDKYIPKIDNLDNLPKVDKEDHLL